MNATRSSAVNMVLSLRQGWLTTPTINESYMFDARPMMSRWPLVTGSNVPGQIALRLSGGGIAVIWSRCGYLVVALRLSGWESWSSSGDMEDQDQGVSVTA